MAYKLTKIRKLRLEEAKNIGIIEDLSLKSTREISTLIKKKKILQPNILPSSVEETKEDEPQSVNQPNIQPSSVEETKEDEPQSVNQPNIQPSSVEEKNIVTLQCVKVGSKLRIRFFCFENAKGEIYKNVYNNQYNCRFPRNIRENGYFYEIDDSNIKLNTGRSTPYYIIKTNGIKIIKPDLEYIKKREKIKIYDVSECVICLENKPTKVFLPCGHMCTCNGCCDRLLKTKSISYYGYSNYLTTHSIKPKCPLCRRIIDKSLSA
mgnify:CR=1 FL=1